MGKVLSTCGFCSCGCALYIEDRKGSIGSLCPSMNHPVNSGRLCIKGWNGTPEIVGADRLRAPLVKKGGSLQSSTWEEAINLALHALKKTPADKTGVIGSAKTTNEECYSLVKLARSVIGTPNVDGPCRFYDASLVYPLIDTVGIPASQVDVDEIPSAGSMLVVGANVMEQLPLIGSAIEKAADSGCKVVAADPRISRIAPHASLFLHPVPDMELMWLRALIKAIFAKKLYSESAPDMSGFEELHASVADAALDASCGVNTAEIDEAVETLASNPGCIVMFGLGVLQQRDSTQIVKALADIAVLLGGKVLPLRGQNNAQGAADVGLMCDFLPGYDRLNNSRSRSAWEKAWDCSLPAKPGMNAVEMLRGCKSGDIKTLLVFGENAALSAPNTAEALAALDSVEFLAVSDIYLNETARLADVVFPACSFLEKEGTFTSGGRRVQRVRKVMEPLGECRTDLHIIAELAAGLGKKMETDPAKVMDEIASNSPIYEGISYKALDSGWGERWQSKSIKPTLAPLEEVSPDPADEEYPLRLIASRINFPTQTGTMAVMSGVLRREYPEPFAEMNESEAAKYGIRRGRTAKISSRSGSILRRVHINNDVPDGCVHVPHYFGGDSANMLASWDCEKVSGVPAYKSCRLRLEAVE